MADKTWYLIAYDIRDPVRLRKVAKHLKGYGQRVQYSLFRCRLDPRQLERLNWELKKLLGRDDDLLFVGLCDGCVARLRKKNLKVDWEFETVRFEVV